jgi:hypothetical protein
MIPACDDAETKRSALENVHRGAVDRADRLRDAQADM